VQRKNFIIKIEVEKIAGSDGTLNAMIEDDIGHGNR
jgi:hypothetical protein